MSIGRRKKTAILCTPAEKQRFPETGTGFSGTAAGPDGPGLGSGAGAASGYIGIPVPPVSPGSIDFSTTYAILSSYEHIRQHRGSGHRNRGGRFDHPHLGPGCAGHRPPGLARQARARARKQARAAARPGRHRLRPRRFHAGPGQLHRRRRGRTPLPRRPVGGRPGAAERLRGGLPVLRSRGNSPSAPS